MADPATPSDFESVALPHLDAVYRFARMLAGDDHAGEDLAQETFVRALQHWSQFEPGTNCRAWLFTICRNYWFRANPRARRETPADTLELESYAAAAMTAGRLQEFGGESFFDAPELPDVLRREMLKLPEEFRAAVSLVDLEDESYESAAAVLGVPVGTVKSRLFRGRRLLQERLLVWAEDAGLRSVKRTP